MGIAHGMDYDYYRALTIRAKSRLRAFTHNPINMPPIVSKSYISRTMRSQSYESEAGKPERLLRRANTGTE